MNVARKWFALLAVAWGLTLFAFPAHASQDAGTKTITPQNNKDIPIPPDAVLAGLEQRYAGKAFCVDFSQTAVLKGMGMTDSASGAACFKFPGKLHWLYKTPEEQFIVSDGTTLWIFRPLDSQVFVGDARQFFGEGEGASFLSDISALKKHFTVSRADKDLARKLGAGSRHALKLVPNKPRTELAWLVLIIDKDTFDIMETVTTNAYGDSTHIRFQPPDFRTDLPDAEFGFSIPKGVDVLSLEDQAMAQ